MKILVFSSYARDTGSWVRTCHIARALGRHADVEVVRPAHRCLPFRLDIPLTFPRYLWKAITTRADVLIAAKPFPNTGLALLCARMVRGTPIVVDFDDLDHGYVSGLPARIIAAAERFFPRRFDLVTYHHEDLARFLRDRGRVSEERLFRLEQGVDLDLFPPTRERATGQDLFFMGHLDAASCLGTILDAVAIVQKERDIELTVVGGGRLERAFRARAEAIGVRARFTGWVPVERVAREMDAAAVCLVYHDETEANAHRCSMKLREYLARGKKVACNDHGELREFAAVTYPSSSRVGDYARAILTALDGDDGREREGMRRIRASSDWAVIAAGFRRRLERLCGGES